MSICCRGYRGVWNNEPPRVYRVDGDPLLIELVVEIAPGSVIPDFDRVGHHDTCGTAGEPKHILSPVQLAQREGYLLQSVEISQIFTPFWRKPGDCLMHRFQQQFAIGGEVLHEKTA